MSYSIPTTLSYAEVRDGISLGKFVISRDKPLESGEYTASFEQYWDGLEASQTVKLTKDIPNKCVFYPNVIINTTSTTFNSCLKVMLYVGNIFTWSGDVVIKCVHKRKQNGDETRQAKRVMSNTLPNTPSAPNMQPSAPKATEKPKFPPVVDEAGRTHVDDGPSSTSNQPPSALQIVQKIVEKLNSSPQAEASRMRVDLSNISDTNITLSPSKPSTTIVIPDTPIQPPGPPQLTNGGELPLANVVYDGSVTMEEFEAQCYKETERLGKALLKKAEEENIANAHTVRLQIATQIKEIELEKIQRDIETKKQNNKQQNDALLAARTKKQ